MRNPIKFSLARNKKVSSRANVKLGPRNSAQRTLRHPWRGFFGFEVAGGPPEIGVADENFNVDNFRCRGDDFSKGKLLDVQKFPNKSRDVWVSPSLDSQTLPRRVLRRFSFGSLFEYADAYKRVR